MSKLIKITTAEKKAAGVVIFIHGLGGDAITTWGGHKKDNWGGKFWPQWLGNEFLDDLDVYSLDYEASGTRWIGGHGMPLPDRATNILEVLCNNDFPKETPILFVCHSLGGLVVKQVIKHAATLQKSDNKVATLLENIYQVIFIATPHNGSGIANIINKLSIFSQPTITMKDLEKNNPWIRDLYNSYRSLNSNKDVRIKHKVFYEKIPYKTLLIVDEGSANPGIDGITPIAVDADHINICKPDNKEDIVFQSTFRAVKEMMNDHKELSENPKQPNEVSSDEEKVKSSKTFKGKVGVVSDDIVVNGDLNIDMSKK